MYLKFPIILFSIIFKIDLSYFWYLRLFCMIYLRRYLDCSIMGFNPWINLEVPFIRTSYSISMDYIWNSYRIIFTAFVIFITFKIVSYIICPYRSKWLISLSFIIHFLALIPWWVLGVLKELQKHFELLLNRRIQ